MSEIRMQHIACYISESGWQELADQIFNSQRLHAYFVFLLNCPLTLVKIITWLFTQYMLYIWGSCQAIITGFLDTKCATAKIVPKFLNFEQKQHCINITQKMMTTFNDDQDFL